MQDSANGDHAEPVIRPVSAKEYSWHDLRQANERLKCLKAKRPKGEVKQTAGTATVSEVEIVPQVIKAGADRSQPISTNFLLQETGIKSQPLTNQFNLHSLKPH